MDRQRSMPRTCELRRWPRQLPRFESWLCLHQCHHTRAERARDTNALGGKWHPTSVKRLLRRLKGLESPRAAPIE